MAAVTICVTLEPKKLKSAIVSTVSPSISHEVMGNQVSDFIFLGSKITADGDCSHEIKDAYSFEGNLWPT